MLAWWPLIVKSKSNSNELFWLVCSWLLILCLQSSLHLLLAPSRWPDQNLLPIPNRWPGRHLLLVLVAFPVLQHSHVAVVLHPPVSLAPPATLSASSHTPPVLQSCHRLPALLPCCPFAGLQFCSRVARFLLRPPAVSPWSHTLAAWVALSFGPTYWLPSRCVSPICFNPWTSVSGFLTLLLTLTLWREVWEPSLDRSFSKLVKLFPVICWKFTILVCHVLFLVFVCFPACFLRHLCCIG